MNASVNRLAEPLIPAESAEARQTEAHLPVTQLASDVSLVPQTEMIAIAHAVIHVIEDNVALRKAERILFEGAGWEVGDYCSAEEFLAAPRPVGDACLVVDVMLPGMNGVALLDLLSTEDFHVPAIMLTGPGDAATAVAALKSGAADFFEKPADWTMLLAAVAASMENARNFHARQRAQAHAKARFGMITPREHKVLMMVLEGKPNRIIAGDLGINQRTVEHHRASVMNETGAASLPALVRLFLEASGSK